MLNIQFALLAEFINHFSSHSVASVEKGTGVILLHSSYGIMPFIGRIFFEQEIWQSDDEAKLVVTLVDENITSEEQAFEIKALFNAWDIARKDPTLWFDLCNKYNADDQRFWAS